ncbi:head-tail connector protein [Streptomyces erythrochromogenes]|uniref:head-tail connector protein n=1 Tax=Streptomyces erythrochromogenes TaxID=285574 RepID=UPI003693AB3F
MADEYANLATLKAQLNLDATDDSRDEQLEQALEAASRGIDRDTGRRFYLDSTATARVINPLRRAVSDDDGDHLLIRDVGSLDGLVVEVGRGGVFTDITASVEAEPTDALDEGRPVTSLLHLGGVWPRGGAQRVRITARWGWPAIPPEIAQATLLQASRLYKRKDSPEGVMGSAEWGVVRVARIDPDVQALIRTFVLPVFA